MLHHVSLGTHRYAEAVAFHRRVLAPLGFALISDSAAEAGFGLPGRGLFYLYPAPPEAPVAGRGMHLAFEAPSRAAVRSVHDQAVAAGGESQWGPRLRPDISATYFGAMFLDLDGHRIEVLTNSVD